MFKGPLPAIAPQAGEDFTHGSWRTLTHTIATIYFNREVSGWVDSELLPATHLQV